MGRGDGDGQEILIELKFGLMIWEIVPVSVLQHRGLPTEKWGKMWACVIKNVITSFLKKIRG